MTLLVRALLGLLILPFVPLVLLERVWLEHGDRAMFWAFGPPHARRLQAAMNAATALRVRWHERRKR